MINIFKTIRDERDDFLNNEIEVVPGYNFSQYETVKKIHLYYNSQYVNGNYDVINGVQRKKVFHNISNWRCEVATKMIDLDVKDFTLISNNPDQDLNVYLLEKELKAWLKKNDMGQILNQISENLPKYGSCILKKNKDDIYLVDLRYLYNDQSAECLEDGRYVLLKNFLSHQELREMGKKGWEKVQDAIDNFSGKYNLGYDQLGNGTSVDGSLQQSNKDVPLVEVFERYGQVPLSWFTDKEKDENEYVLAKYICAGVDEVTKNDEGVITEEDGIVLYKEQIDEMPFKEVHYNRTNGRWLGIGIVETLFENQRRINEVKNQEAMALELASVQLFQTRDTTIASNILTDVNNGEILRVKSEITPIATESRNVTGFKVVSDEIEQHSDSLTFSRDVVSGENPPASATLGAIQIQTQQTTAVFEYKKENIGLFLSEFIEDLVFPQIEKELNKEHVLRLTGSFEEMQKLRNNFVVNCTNREFFDKIISDDNFDPTQENYDLIKETYTQKANAFGDKIWTKVIKNFFKDLDYYVDLTITGENKNPFAQIQNGQALLMTMQKDPTIMQDPVKKKLLFKIMSNMGWHMSELEDLNSTQPSPMQMQQMQQMQLQANQPQMAQQNGQGNLQ